MAILLFDGVQIIDYAGPYEVFGQAGFRVFTVAAGPGPITTNMEMRVTPTYTLENAPNRWEVRWEIRTATPIADLEKGLAEHLTKQGGWTAQAGSAKAGKVWRYTDADRRPWSAEVDLRPVNGKSGEYLLAIRVERVAG